MWNAFTSANGAEITSGLQAASQLEQLNADFLGLLILEWRQTPTPAESLRLATLSFESLDALAAASASVEQMAVIGFSLFGLSFENPELWRRMARSSETVEQRYAVVGSEGEAGERRFTARRSGFIECALFYAWHLAHLDRAAARLQLGLGDELIELLPQLELWRIRQIALRHPDLLAPRWPENGCFWPDLLRYAASADLQHFESARLLGSQLLAQELEPSLIERLANRRKKLFKPSKGPQ